MALNKDFPYLFQPIKVGPVTLKNRLHFAPHVSAHADVETGRVTTDLIEYIGGQARNGVSLITIGSTPVDFSRGRDYMGCLSVTNDFDVPGLTMLAEEAHRYGAKISCELQYAGRIADPLFLGGMKALVPWVTPDMDPNIFDEITKEEIDEIVNLFVVAAKRLKRAGFDMVMLHGGHGNLTSAFFSPLTNQRTDEYGGSLEKRMTFGLKMAKALRDAVGDKMAIEFRLSQNEFLPGSPTLDEQILYINALSEYIDIVNISNGLIWHPYYVRYMLPSYLEPRSINVEAAAYIKKHVHIPVSVVGNIPDVYTAEQIVAEGKADVVSMVRNFIADSDFVTKAARGKADQIRPCLHCLNCVTFPNVGHPLRCAVNPTVGRETKYHFIQKAEVKKRILIIGGGVAGMMAAQTCTMRGHSVILCEKSDHLGGRLMEASALIDKDYHRRYIEWDVDATMNCGAEIRLNTLVTEELVREINPDVTVIAIGAHHNIPDIPGLKNADYVTITEADLKQKPLGKKVVFCGAGLSATECAIGLAREGHECVLIDKLAQNDLYTVLMDSLAETLKTTCTEENISVYDQSDIKEINSKSVTIEKDGTSITLDCDTVVLSLGLHPDAAEIEEFNFISNETYIIGDCNTVGNIRTANMDAFNVCVEI